MKRVGFLLAAFATLSGCEQGGESSDAYRRLSDQMIVSLGLMDFGVFPCHDSDRVDQCYKMEPQRRWKGLWRNDFEGSQFCDDLARECSYVPKNDRSEPITWLDVEHVTKKEPDGELYAVDLIGRRTAVAGHYGHFGMFDHELIVDRVISIEKIPGQKYTKR